MGDWPPVIAAGRPHAGPGVDPSLLGAIPYSAQSSVMNIGIRQFGGHWYALSPTGRVVR